MAWKIEVLEQENAFLKAELDKHKADHQALESSFLRLNNVHCRLVQHLRTHNTGSVNVDALLSKLNADDGGPDDEVLFRPTHARDQGRAVNGALGAAVEPTGPFSYLHDLVGHKGSVYAVDFSPVRRNILASGSFDRTVRVWDLSATPGSECRLVLEGHAHNVSDVTWAQDGELLVSGSFDHTVRAWSVGAAGKALGTWEVAKDAFVQCVGVLPNTNAQVILVASTSPTVLAFDRRAPAGSGAAFKLDNGSMVNTLACLPDGRTVLTGDRAGDLKTWDVDDVRVTSTVNVGGMSRPISHVGLSPESEELRAGRYVTVNSYDNVLRVFDRGASEGDPCELIQAFEGHVNRNWPIRSSLFIGRNFHRARPIPRRATPGPEGVSGPGAGDDDWRWRAALDDTMLVATGSADDTALVFDAGAKPAPGRAQAPVQTLSGHEGRVHAAVFQHSMDAPRLATCSADFRIKIWGAKAGRGVQ